MIPDFKGHHFAEDTKPGEPSGLHHCDRCGLKASLRPDGSVLCDIEWHGVFLKTGNIVPFNSSRIRACTEKLIPPRRGKSRH
jgi:hypothetical protein